MSAAVLDRPSMTSAALLDGPSAGLLALSSQYGLQSGDHLVMSDVGAGESVNMPSNRWPNPLDDDELLINKMQFIETPRERPPVPNHILETSNIFCL